MTERLVEAKLEDGTLVRHRVLRYEGRIEGITEIKTCFTDGGEPLIKTGKQIFQHRVAVQGELMRRIAPAEDLEIVESVAKIVCGHCHAGFQSKPGIADKPGGRCQCGEWICPSCLACQGTNGETANGQPSRCLKQTKRLATKTALKKRRAAH
ncbi:MAG: hypothetical protein HY695_26800 [Deltaproteobacteria bacterium]|nr:hypothetical protein [Deltaproteobacteria bacterium]